MRMVVTSAADFETLVSKTGLPLSALQVEQLREAWALVEPMLESNLNTKCDINAGPPHDFRVGHEEPVGRQEGSA
jgi:hypothetical protein